MRRFLQYLVPAACVVLILAALTVISPRRSEAQFASPVRITNSSDNPALTRDVDNAARQPFVLNVNSLISNNSIGVFTGTGALVAGRKYVILSVSINSTISKGTDSTWVGLVFTTSAGSFAEASFPVQNVAPGFNGGVQDIFAATQPVYITPDPGTTVTVGVQRTGTTGSGNINFTLTGYSVAQ